MGLRLRFGLMTLGCCESGRWGRGSLGGLLDMDVDVEESLAVWLVLWWWGREWMSLIIVRLQDLQT